MRMLICPLRKTLPGYPEICGWPVMRKIPEKPMTDPIRIYTDGACRGNPGPGGWGAVLMHGGKVKKLYGGEQETTNNRMELTAVIKALECIKGNKWSLEITSDSKYVLQGITEWIEGWKRKGWRSASKKP